MVRSIESSLFFSFGRRNGAFRAVLIHFVKDDDDIGRVSGSNLSHQKSEVDEYISPSFIKLGSKLMEQDKSKKNDIIDEFGFGIYGCRRKLRYRSSCCGYHSHIASVQFKMELLRFPAWGFKVFFFHKGDTH